MQSRRSGALVLMGVGAAYLVALSATFHATSWSRKAELTVVGGTLEAFGVALVSIDFGLRGSSRLLVTAWTPVRLGFAR
jgi:hypothetical protein